MPSLSRTAAKRQAHRESHLYRPDHLYRPAPGTLWDVVINGEIGPAHQGLTYARARRELAAWRAARVEELMGGRSPHAHPPSFEANCPVCAAQKGLWKLGEERAEASKKGPLKVNRFSTDNGRTWQGKMPECKSLKD